jgi:hypothetical protein
MTPTIKSITTGASGIVGMGVRQAKYNDLSLTRTVSDHSSPEAVKKHYPDQVVMAKL